MLVKQTSLSLVGSRFLGTKDHVLLAGNITNHVGRLQINYCQHKNEVDGMLTLNAVADSVIHQQISCMEVISIPRLAKSYIAVAGQSAQDHGALSFVNIEMNKQSATMSLDSLDVFNQSFGVENFPRITSMSFLAERELLAIATEAGDISLLDLYSRKHLMTIRADATGINKIEFTPAGQIVCVGNSVDTPMKIFDIRQNDRESNITPAMSYTRKQSQHSYKAVSNDMDIVEDSDPYARVYNRSLSLRAPGYTTVTSHPSQAAVIAGDTNGNIIHWDLRSNASIEYNPHGSVGKCFYYYELLYFFSSQS